MTRPPLSHFSRIFFLLPIAVAVCVTRVPSAQARVPQVDLAITLSVTDDLPTDDDVRDVEVSLFNNGPDTAKRVRALVAIPGGFVFRDDLSSDECRRVGRMIACVAPMLAPDEEAAFFLSFEVRTFCTPQALRARASGLARDTKRDNNSATVSLTCADPSPDPTTPAVAQNAPADVSIFKTLPAAGLSSSADATITLLVSNFGPGTAKNVAFTDDHGGNLTLLGSPGHAQCTDHGNSVECSLGELAPGKTVSVPLRYRLVSSSACSGDIATVTSVRSNADTNPANNSAQLSIKRSCAKPSTVDLEVETARVTWINGQPRAEVTIFNQGPSITDALLTISLPGGMKLKNAAPSPCTFLDGVLTCRYAQFQPSKSNTLLLDLTQPTSSCSSTQAAALTMRVEVSTVTGQEVYPTNNKATAVFNAPCTSPSSLGLSVMRSYGQSVKQGASLYTTIVVKNQSDTEVSFLTVTDTVPSGFTLNTQFSSPSCAAVSGTVTCSLFTLISGASKQFSVVYDAPILPCNSSVLLSPVKVASGNPSLVSTEDTVGHSVSITCAQPVTNPVLHIIQKAMTPKNYMVPGQKDVTLFAFDASAQGTNVRLSHMELRSDAGQLSAMTNYRLVYDTNGDGTFEGSLVSSATADAQQLAFDSIDTGVLIPSNTTVSFQLRADVTETPTATALLFRFPWQTFPIVAMAEIDGRQLAGVKINGLTCQVSRCDIQLQTGIATNWIVDLPAQQSSPQPVASHVGGCWYDNGGPWVSVHLNKGADSIGAPIPNQTIAAGDAVRIDYVWQRGGDVIISPSVVQTTLATYQGYAKIAPTQTTTYTLTPTVKPSCGVTFTVTVQ